MPPKKIILVLSVLFILVAVPAGIVINNLKKLKADTPPDIVYEKILEPQTTEELDGVCKKVCVTECKRADNCFRADSYQIGHCGWTHTKPVSEKKWCRICTRICPTPEPTEEPETIDPDILPGSYL